ncbi:MAG: amidohydrolase family protein, partial [Sulfurimonas sp.]|nr:amidohydrolase family protein [Sulfurimonas sp.]
MQILVPNYILTPDTLLKNMAVLFEKHIIKIAPLHELQQKWPEVEVVQLDKNSLLMPGLINAHVHIEFSANKTQLSYGDFMSWLYSVIENRDTLMDGCDKTCMSEAISAM